MRSLMTITITTLFLMLAACQPADEGLNNPNNANDLQRTGFGDQGDNFYNYNQNPNPNNMNGYTNRGNNDSNLNTRNRMNNRDNNGMINRNNNRTNNDTQDRTRMNQNDNNFDVADRIADRVTDEVNEVERAYVLSGDNNAYVAVVLDRDDNARNNDTNEDYDIDEGLKQRVTDAVQNADNSIENVYVSANPDFLQMVDDYVNDVQNGEPIEGFFEEFNNMLERIFPNLNR
ncbi:YhcN/YlaJ family sporulation lipoprotein [Bacillaceae bacterium W0354]